MIIHIQFQFYESCYRMYSEKNLTNLNCNKGQICFPLYWGKRANEVYTHSDIPILYHVAEC